MKTLVTVYNSQLKKLIFNEPAVKKLHQLTDVTWVKEDEILSKEELSECISEYDICITSWGSPKIDAAVLKNAVNLKFLGHAAGTVVPYIDEGFFEREIIVVNSNTFLACSTAEATLALMLAGSWKLKEYSESMRHGIWSKNLEETVPGIARQTIGLIGYGDISRELIRLLKPFSPTILLYSQHCTSEEAELSGIQLSSLDELLSKSRIISLHNTLNPNTLGMIGKKQLDLIQDGALLVNTARGPIVDEAALMDTLGSGRIFAALDVYHKEPVGVENSLLSLPNVLCTPHIGGFCRHWKNRLGDFIIDELERWLQGKPLSSTITKDKFLRLTPL